MSFNLYRREKRRYDFDNTLRIFLWSVVLSLMLLLICQFFIYKKVQFLKEENLRLYDNWSLVKNAGPLENISAVTEDDSLLTDEKLLSRIVLEDIYKINEAMVSDLFILEVNYSDKVFFTIFGDCQSLSFLEEFTHNLESHGLLMHNSQSEKLGNSYKFRLHIKKIESGE